LSGTLTDPPVDGVKETPTTVALKESMLIFPGGGSGTARSATSNVVPLPWPSPPTVGGNPLQDAKAKDTAKNPEAASFLWYVCDPMDGIVLQATSTRPSIGNGDVGFARRLLTEVPVV
jgi:hypothetical protein